MCGTVSKFLLTTIMYFNWVPPPSPLSCCIVFLHFNKSGLGDTYPTTTLLFVLLIVSDQVLKQGQNIAKYPCYLITFFYYIVYSKVKVAFLEYPELFCTFVHPIEAIDIEKLGLIVCNRKNTFADIVYQVAISHFNRS